MFRGQSLHLDHAPTGGYLGLSHEACNVRAGGKVGNAIRNGRVRRPDPAPQEPLPDHIDEHDCPVHGRCTWRLPCW